MTDDPEIRIIRSTRRRATIAARWAEDGRVLEVLAPAGMPEPELSAAVERLKQRALRRLQRPDPASDGALFKRAAELNRQYFRGELRVSEIKYVTNQNRRFGSCSPVTKTIRISHRVAAMPNWVLDYVIVHELAHLLEPNHGARFWKLVGRYPLAERARGYLIAVGLEGDADEPGTLDLGGCD